MWVQVQRTYRRCQCSGACMRMSSVRCVVTTSHIPALISRDVYLLFSWRNVPVKCKSYDHLQSKFIQAFRSIWASFNGLGFKSKSSLPDEFDVSVDAGE